jgi:hypothetical protein
MAVDYWRKGDEQDRKSLWARAGKNWVRAALWRSTSSRSISMASRSSNASRGNGSVSYRSDMNERFGALARGWYHLAPTQTLGICRRISCYRVVTTDRQFYAAIESAIKPTEMQ